LKPIPATTQPNSTHSIIAKTAPGAKNTRCVYRPKKLTKSMIAFEYNFILPVAD
jgi:hypothetical protein